MCKQSCCPGDDAGSGFRAVLVVLAVALVLGAAGAIERAAQDLITIMLVAAGSLAALSVVAVCVFVVLRLRSGSEPERFARMLARTSAREALSGRTLDARELPAAPACRALPSGSVRLSGLSAHVREPLRARKPAE